MAFLFIQHDKGLNIIGQSGSVADWFYQEFVGSFPSQVVHLTFKN